MDVKNCHYCHYRLHFHFLVPSKATIKWIYENGLERVNKKKETISSSPNFRGFCLLWCNMRLIMPIDKWVFNFFIFIFSSVINKIGVYYQLGYIRWCLWCNGYGSLGNTLNALNITLLHRKIVWVDRICMNCTRIHIRKLTCEAAQ